MSEHPNVTTVNRMTEAIVAEDHETLASLFTDDFVYHLRGPFATAGDHLGVEGILGAIQTQAALLLLGSVTTDAAGLEQRFDVAREVHLLCSRGRQDGAAQRDVTGGCDPVGQLGERRVSEIPAPAVERSEGGGRHAE